MTAPTVRRQVPEEPGVCPFCGSAYDAVPNQCPRCGTLLGVAAEDLAHLGRAERRLLQSRKALADLFFLVGLLVGGPMMSFGGQVRIGAFVVLAGAVASMLRRYSDWSTPGTVLVGSLVALVAASWVVEPSAGHTAEASAAQDARRGYATALSSQDPDILVEARGPSLVTLWYTIPAEMTGSCGQYPSQGTRTHLRELGFKRIVVREPNGHGGVCSFAP
jgi:hypothetical protein